jgi:hypothetical protein
MIEVTFDRHAERVPRRTLPFPVPASAEDAGSITERLSYLLASPDGALPDGADAVASLRRDLPGILHAAFERRDEDALLDVHKALCAVYELSFLNPLGPAVTHERSPWLVDFRNAVETAWLAAELPEIEADVARTPRSQLETPSGIGDWFVEKAREESELDRRVVQYLAEEATVDDFKLFVLAEAQLNYRFYDALVLAQLHFAESVKGEISHHMWDECGCGTLAQAHTNQFTRSLEALDLEFPEVPIWEDWRPYAGYNLYLLLGLTRRQYFKAIGSLAMPELFDPDRDRAVVAGFERLGFDEVQFEYFYSHIEADEDHGPGWVEHVIVPIVALEPEAAVELAVGGALRMEAMRRYNAYLAARFGLTP